MINSQNVELLLTADQINREWKITLKENFEKFRNDMALAIQKACEGFSFIFAR